MTGPVYDGPAENAVFLPWSASSDNNSGMLHLIGVDVEYASPRALRVLHGLNLAISEGGVTVVSGPVGVGKSTLIRVAAGELFATRGEVRVLGHDLARLRRSSLEAMRRQMAWIPQELRLLDDRSALENVAVAAQVAGASGREARTMAAAALAAVGMAEMVDVPPWALSSGQRRRVSMARGLVAEPRVILADEPSGDLDPAGVALLVSVLEAQAAKGTSILMTTHDDRVLSAARARGWTHLQLHDGRLEAPATGRERSPMGGVVVPFPHPALAGGIE